MDPNDDEQLYDVIDDIKIYTGTTRRSHELYMKSIDYLKSLIKDSKLFTDIEPSTLTAQGSMSNVSFDEREIFDMLSDPRDNILMIGCNYGEKFNPNYVIPEAAPRSGRGRKPKPKPKTQRKPQGSGKYFSSQITFLIRHPETSIIYKIKLFRNGVFQVPGIKDPSMSDLVMPICILRDYLAYNFDEDVQVLNFRAVMRNYKSKLIDSTVHIDLEELENCINRHKSYQKFLPALKKILKPLAPKFVDRALKFIGKTNPLNIAEITYNTDRCFSLILKFYRPTKSDMNKKTTVKLLKRGGKINFDGGNSELEILELYYWIQYIYTLHQKDIIVDVSKIKNEYNIDDYNKYCAGKSFDHLYGAYEDTPDYMHDTEYEKYFDDTAFYHLYDDPEKVEEECKNKKYKIRLCECKTKDKCNHNSNQDSLMKLFDQQYIKDQYDEQIELSSDSEAMDALVESALK